MRNFLWMGVVVLSVLGRPAVADELFRYNYIKVDSQKVTQHAEGYSPKIDGSSAGVFGSYAIQERVAIGIQYNKSKTSFNGSYLGTAASFNAKENELALGATLHKMVSDNAELAFYLALNHTTEDAYTERVGSIQNEIPAFTTNSHTFGIRAGIAIVPEFRIGGSIGRTTGGNSNATTHYGISAEYEIAKNFNLEGGYCLSTSSPGHSRGISISGRYYYGMEVSKAPL
jgi:hypothetical protein